MISSSLKPGTSSQPCVPSGRLAFPLTPRALLLLLAGTLWLVPGFSHPRFCWGVLVWDIVVLAAGLFDARQLPSPESIVAERSWSNAPALANETEIELAILQRTGARGRVLLCALLDDLPDALVQTPEPLLLMAYPNVRASVRYRFTPRERGDHQTGSLYLRYRSATGLVERWALAKLTQTVRIYPTLRAGEEQQLFLARTRQIELQLRLQRQRGLGRDFESLREYRQGDDMRDVCWTASARHGALITQQYQTEKSQAVWIVLDAGRLQRARIDGYTKLDYSTGAALALAQLALFSGDRVGLLAYGQGIQQRVGLGRGAGHLRQLVETLALVQSETAEADHLRATATLNRMQPRRSLILWITDLAETAMRPEVVDGASQLLRRHLLLFVAMGQVDVQQIAAARPATASGMYRSAAAQELVQRRELLLARLRGQGALTLETTPQATMSAVLNRYLSVKEEGLL
ncbi:MAG TPA: DUF58 domain-containing protein [Acidisarcina sp.]